MIALYKRGFKHKELYIRNKHDQLKRDSSSNTYQLSRTRAGQAADCRNLYKKNFIGKVRQTHRFEKMFHQQ